MVNHCRKTLELCFLTGNYLGMPSLPKGVCGCWIQDQKPEKLGSLMFPNTDAQTASNWHTSAVPDCPVWRPLTSWARAPPQTVSQMLSGYSLFPCNPGEQFSSSSYQPSPGGLLASSARRLWSNKDAIYLPQSIAGLREGAIPVVWADAASPEHRSRESATSPRLEQVVMGVALISGLTAQCMCQDSNFSPVTAGGLRELPRLELERGEEWRQRDHGERHRISTCKMRKPLFHGRLAALPGAMR